MSGRRAVEIDQVVFLIWRDEIERTKSRGKSCVSELVRTCAQKMEVSTRSVWRWVKGKPAGRVRAALTAQDHGQIRRASGNLAKAHRDSAFGKSLSTYRRAFKDLEPAIQKGLKGGAKAAKSRQHYLHFEVRHRNDRWEIDHGLAPIWVRHPETGRLVRPWLTIIVDCYSGVYVGWAFTIAENGAADTSSILAALGAAIARYGRPKSLVFDQGADFVGKTLSRALLRIDVQPDPTAKETPEHKPYVERAVGVIKAEFFPGQPGFSIPRKRAA